MLLAGGGTAVMGDSGFEALVEKPLAPHVPDDPTESEVLCLLGQLTYSISYFAQGKALAPPAGLMGGTAYELVPCLGICWQAEKPQETATVYIEGKPYSVPTRWLPFP